MKPAFYRILIYADENGVIDLSRRDLREKLSVSDSTIKRYLRELARHGLVEKKDGIYRLTEKGERLRRSLLNTLRVREVSPDKGYVITEPSTAAPLPLRLLSLEHLYAVIRYGLAPRDILLHHLRTGYLSQWIRSVLGDEALADQIDSMKDVDDIYKFMEVIEERLKILESIAALEERD